MSRKDGPKALIASLKDTYTKALPFLPVYTDNNPKSTIHAAQGHHPLSTPILRPHSLDLSLPGSVGSQYLVQSTVPSTSVTHRDSADQALIWFFAQASRSGISMQVRVLKYFVNIQSEAEQNH